MFFFCFFNIPFILFFFFLGGLDQFILIYIPNLEALSLNSQASLLYKPDHVRIYKGLVHLIKNSWFMTQVTLDVCRWTTIVLDFQYLSDLFPRTCHLGERFWTFCLYNYHYIGHLWYSQLILDTSGVCMYWWCIY